MDGRNRMNGSQGRHFQWGSYGFLAGLLVGVMMGWLFAGFVGALVRVGMLALVIVPIVLIYIGWRKIVVPWLRPPVERQYQYMVQDNAIETRAVVQGAVSEPRTR